MWVDAVVFRLGHFAHARGCQLKAVFGALSTSDAAFLITLNRHIEWVNPFFRAVFSGVGESFGQHHALGEQVLKRFVAVHQTRVTQQLVEEAGVQQVQNCVLDTTDVLVDREPIIGFFRVEHLGVVLRRAVTRVIPGGFHEGIEGIGFAERRLTIQFDVFEFRVVLNWRVDAVHHHVGWQNHWLMTFRRRNGVSVLSTNNRNW